MKYIMLYNAQLDKHVPIIFPDSIVHYDICSAHGLYMHPRTGWIPVAAGEYHIATGEVSGFSETLRLQSRPQDAAIIATMNYRHGLMFDPEPAPYLPRRK